MPNKKELEELTKMAVSQYNKNLYCRYCAAHIEIGHTINCPLVVKAKQVYGREWVRENLRTTKRID